VCVCGGWGSRSRRGKHPPYHYPNTHAHASIPHPRWGAPVPAPTFFTIFCSSMMNARRMRSRTQCAQREPPYARFTVRSWEDRRRSSLVRRRGT
jgi:hypothetical protein